MATFLTCIRNKRKDGLYPVYIRVTHNRSVQYINTGKLVNDKGLRVVYDKNGKAKTEIKDSYVLKECAILIEGYKEKINRIDASNIDSKNLVTFLSEPNEELSFTDYMANFITKMKNEGRDNSSDNYKTSLNSLRSYFNKDNIYFSEMTSRKINGWIESMKNTARAKSLYPSCVRKVFYSAMKEYNDYDIGKIRIKINPFPNVEIPAEDIPQKRSVGVIDIIKLFCVNCDLPKVRNEISRVEMARDVAMMIFCLAGINAADLYDLEEDALTNDWRLCYRRKKTRSSRKSDPYLEITVPEFIRPLFAKYRGVRGKLFIFNSRYADSDAFVSAVDKGLKKFCEMIGIAKLTTYSLRHTWATIGQNNCGATISDIAFAFTHASEHKVTERYIKEDYSRIDRLNEKIMHFTIIESFLPYIPIWILAS